MGQLPPAVAGRTGSGRGQPDRGRREAVHLPLEKRRLAHPERAGPEAGPLPHPTGNAEGEPTERDERDRLQQPGVQGGGGVPERQAPGGTADGMHGTEGGLQRRGSGVAQGDGPRLRARGLPGTGRGERLCDGDAGGTGRSGEGAAGRRGEDERPGHPGAQEPEHRHDSGLL